MYITRFTKTDGCIEDYYYHSQDDAVKHLSLFENDDSGLYTRIDVLEDLANTVIKTLLFEQ